MKKFLFIVIVMAFSLCMVNFCSAERVLITHYHKNGQYTGEDFCMETSGIQKGVARFILRNKQQVPQYAVLVPTEVIIAETGKSKYQTTWYVFFKNKNGEWFHGTTAHKYLGKVRSTGMLYVDAWGGYKLNTRNRTMVNDLFDKANEYFDFNSIENTEADERGIFPD